MSSSWTDEQVVKFVIEGNELGLGYMLAALLKGAAKYPIEWGEWIIWDNTYWRRDIGSHHIRRLMEELLAPVLSQTQANYIAELAAIDQNDASQKQRITALQVGIKAMKDALKKIRSRSGGENVIDMATRCKAGVSRDIPASVLDQHPALLSTLNAVVNMATADVIDMSDVTIREKYLSTKCAPVEWRGLHTPRPMFERFIKEIFNDNDELTAFIQRLFGYIASGVCTEHIFPIFQGGGRNGKSALIKILSTVLGEDIAGPVNTELLYVQQNRGSAGPSPDIRSFHGRRFAFASEAAHNKKLDVARIKWLTGGDDLIARAPHEPREFRWRPTHTLILVTNPNPPLDYVDFAFARRLLFIPFMVSFVEDPQKPNEKLADHRIADKICQQEAPGVLAWIVEGYLQYLAVGLSPPKIVTDATAKYIQEEDLIAYFLGQVTTEEAVGFVTSKDIYDVYRQWCRIDYGCSEKEIMSHKSLGKLISQKYQADRVGHSSQRGYRGLSLNQRGEELLQMSRLAE